jgi:hypothetical protein
LQPGATAALVAAVFVDEGLELAAELFGEVFIADGVEQRQRRLVGLELGNAPRALGQVVFQLCVHCGGKLMLDIICQKADEVRASAIHDHAEC